MRATQEPLTHRPAQRVDTAESLAEGLQRSFAEPGPQLLEVVIAPVFSPRQLKAMPYALRALTALPRPVAAAVKRRLYP